MQKQSNQSFLESNLLALSATNSSLASKISYAEESDQCLIKESRTGMRVPFLKKHSRAIPLHSTFDPVKEGYRFYSTFKAKGYIIILGFGAGYHILPFLEDKQISEILVIDKGYGFFKKILTNFNLTSLFLDKRVRILIDPSPDDISKHILENYIPAISGNLDILKLRSRVDMENEFFSNVTKTINDVITPLSEDFSVQSYFGKRWFINTILNLKAAEKTTTVISPVKKALIAGAGPSLEKQLPQLEEHSKDGFLISTDTAFPALLKNGIKPDLILSIDCQHITFHHFMTGIPDDIPLVLDLASPQLITRLTDNVLFFTSGHPFSLYVKKRWREFPFIDTSGGNVSHAAVSLAYSLGAKKIFLFGVDFSYPYGKSYARGTYLYPYFSSLTNRKQPLEDFFIDFIFHNDETNHVTDNRSSRYVTKPMISYKKRLEKLISGLNSKVIIPEGDGEIIEIPEYKEHPESDEISSIFSAGPADFSWNHFLFSYYKDLASLPVPTESISGYMNSLTSRQKEVCITLFPAAAAIRRTCSPDTGGMEILKKTHDWTVKTVAKVIAS